MTHQAQVTCCGLSYKSGFFYSATVPGETFHCAKRFAVVREEGTAEGLFDKDPDPPPPEIHNSTAPPSAPGDHIDAGVFNASTWAEDISLVRNLVLEVDDNMEPANNNVTLVETPSSDTLFEGQ